MNKETGIIVCTMKINIIMIADLFMIPMIAITIQDVEMDTTTIYLIIITKNIETSTTNTNKNNTRLNAKASCKNSRNLVENSSILSNFFAVDLLSERNRIEMENLAKWSAEGVLVFFSTSVEK